MKISKFRSKILPQNLAFALNFSYIVIEPDKEIDIAVQFAPFLNAVHAPFALFEEYQVDNGLKLKET